jgi:hypothetical protein
MMVLQERRRPAPVFGERLQQPSRRLAETDGNQLKREVVGFGQSAWPPKQRGGARPPL